MAIRSNSSLCRAATALALMLVLEGCTPGGQFDPTTLFNSDMFDSKTKLKGQREPLFPNGVPGTTTGVPADLVKGYQPPPDQASADPDSINAPPPDQAAQPQAKPKPKPTPKIAVGRPRTRAAKVEKPPSSQPTRIDIGAKGAPPQQPSGAPWPNSPPAAKQGGQFAWPSAPQSAPAQQAAQPSQSIWPAPPPTAPAQPAAAPSAASNSQTSQSFDSMWPKPTAAGSTTTQ